MTNYCVYLHTSPTNKYYVGITKQNPLKRWALDLNNNVICVWESATDAGKALNIDNSGISRACREGESGKYKGKYKNFKWKYF